mmetsp:Transcript_20279/g.49012  ORF Transcript_20279/g.49012 Transcript_20279/m.49012 type:complete len:467 (+) Transcript_20279:1920-3320(+)
MRVSCRASAPSTLLARTMTPECTAIHPSRCVATAWCALRLSMRSNFSPRRLSMTACSCHARIAMCRTARSCSRSSARASCMQRCAVLSHARNARHARRAPLRSATTHERSAVVRLAASREAVACHAPSVMPSVPAAYARLHLSCSCTSATDVCCASTHWSNTPAHTSRVCASDPRPSPTRSRRWSAASAHHVATVRSCSSLARRVNPRVSSARSVRASPVWATHSASAPRARRLEWCQVRTASTVARRRAAAARVCHAARTREEVVASERFWISAPRSLHKRAWRVRSAQNRTCAFATSRAHRRPAESSFRMTLNPSACSACHAAKASERWVRCWRWRPLSARCLMIARDAASCSHAWSAFTMARSCVLSTIRVSTSRFRSWSARRTVHSAKNWDVRRDARSVAMRVYATESREVSRACSRHAVTIVRSWSRSHRETAVLRRMRATRASTARTRQMQMAETPRCET